MKTTMTTITTPTGRIRRDGDDDDDNDHANDKDDEDDNGDDYKGKDDETKTTIAPADHVRREGTKTTTKMKTTVR